MNAPAPTHPNPWTVIQTLAAKARSADSEEALCFAMVNDSFALLPYRSALLLMVEGGALRLKLASGLTSVERKSPYGSWVEQAVQALLSRIDERGRFGAGDVPEGLREAWSEYWPEQVHLFAVPSRDGKPMAVLVYVSDIGWPSSAAPMLAALHQVYGACLEASRLRASVIRRFGRRPDGRLSTGTKLFALAVVVTIGAMFIPVRQFVISPAEIISLDSIAVTSPVEGIIATLAARPNQPVRRGEVLARLDDTMIRNRLESARQALEVSRAEFLAGAHRSFLATERTTEVGVLRGRIAERVAEVAFLEDQLALLEIRASRDGIAVYGQENDLIGKPVSPGQRIMELADPSRIGAHVWVPVADAINLNAGERVNLMLYADPLTQRGATIEQASYQAIRSPDGVAAYRVRAILDSQDASRLGLRGNAKIDGEPVALGYFLFRRPIVVARQWLGI